MSNQDVRVAGWRGLRKGLIPLALGMMIAMVFVSGAEARGVHYIDADQVCREQHHLGMEARLLSKSPFAIGCWGVGSSETSLSSGLADWSPTFGRTESSRMDYVGGLDMQAFCDRHYPGTRAKVARWVSYFDPMGSWYCE